ncbi:MAG: MBL fold metallo-hydrolase [Microbacteriaceae bacterium]|nr:MBL fold metallo-hydrolase [Microbacteriaceae bacterium]
MIATHEVVDRVARKAGRMPEIERISARVWAVPVSCSLPVRYTFAYLVVGDDDRFIVIDPGAETPEGREQLLGGLDAAGLELRNLAGVVGTHWHWDHMEAAERLVAETGAWFGLHPLERWPVAGTPELEERVQAYTDWLAASGAPAEVVAELGDRKRGRGHLFETELATLPLADGMLLPLAGRTLRVVVTPGHTAGSVCIVDEDEEVLFTGDHVLPTIHPNIGAFEDRPDEDTVSGYLASLQKIARWSDFQICPGHEYHFRGLAERTEQLRARLERRLAEVAAIRAANPGASPWELTSLMPWRRGWEGLTNPDREDALAVTRAHLNHLDQLNTSGTTSFAI